MRLRLFLSGVLGANTCARPHSTEPLRSYAARGVRIPRPRN